MNTTIVGTKFRGGAAIAALGRLETGTVLELRREPLNQYDANAVAVYFQGMHLGYVPAAVNAGVAAALDKGDMVRAVLTMQAVVNGAAIAFPPRLRIDIQEDDLLGPGRDPNTGLSP